MSIWDNTTNVTCAALSHLTIASTAISCVVQVVCPTTSLTMPL